MLEPKLSVDALIGFIRAGFVMKPGRVYYRKIENTSLSLVARIMEISQKVIYYSVNNY
ncbi:MAG: hypothetical protein ABRQ37_06515 [Candidatus Eremiobacterota bacterium]